MIKGSTPGPTERPKRSETVLGYLPKTLRSKRVRAAQGSARQTSNEKSQPTQPTAPRRDTATMVKGSTPGRPTGRSGAERFWATCPKRFAQQTSTAQRREARGKASNEKNHPHTQPTAPRRDTAKMVKGSIPGPTDRPKRSGAERFWATCPKRLRSKRAPRSAGSARQSLE